MGNGSSKNGLGGKAQRKQRRQSQWGSTGLIALRDAKLKELPGTLDDPAAYGNARTLDVTSNRLKHLPEWLGNFASLQRLALSRNQLGGLPPQIQQLTNLKVLLLDHNKLSALPDAVLRLPALSTLALSNNALTSVPGGVSQLTALSQLHLNGNRLEALPPQLGRCTALAELDVSNNRLQDLPAELGELQRLTLFSADSNAIARVPSAILTGCTSLTTFTLHDNPIPFAELEATKGYQGLEQRRRNKFDKVLSGGAMLNADGLAEGVARVAI